MACFGPGCEEAWRCTLGVTDFEFVDKIPSSSAGHTQARAHQKMAFPMRWHSSGARRTAREPVAVECELVAVRMQRGAAAGVDIRMAAEDSEELRLRLGALFPFSFFPFSFFVFVSVVCRLFCCLSSAFPMGFTTNGRSYRETIALFFFQTLYPCG